MTCAKVPQCSLSSDCSVKVARSNLGRGCLTGRLVGFNRHFIEEEIPHIGVLLSTDLEEVVRRAEVLVVGAKALNEETILATLRPDQFVVDLRSLGPVAQPPRKWPVTRCYGLALAQIAGMV